MATYKPTFQAFDGMTPQQVASRRKVAEALTREGMSSEPVGHWTQALARVAQSGVGGFQMGSANKMEAEGRRDANVRLTQALTNKAPMKDVASSLMGNPWSEDTGHDLAVTSMKNDAKAAADDPRREYAQRASVAEEQGLERGTPEWKSFVLTGKLPSASASSPNVTEIFDEATGQPRKVIIGPDGSMQPIGGVRAPEKRDAGLSVVEKKAVFESEDSLPALDATVGALERAKALNKKTFEGMTSGLRGSLGTAFSPDSLPGQLVGGVVDRGAAEATNEWGNLMNMEAIQAMAATLKGATTNFELEKFVEVLANPSTPPATRERTIERMLTLANQRRQTARDRIKELRSTGLRPSNGAPAPSETVNPQTGDVIDLGDGFNLEFSQ
jgi:hypothetical protein